MSINAGQLRSFVVNSTLKRLDLWSPVAENLLMGTAAQESHLGTYLKQLGSGPALGIFQMEPATHEDIWDNFLAYKKELRGRVLDATPSIYQSTTKPFVHSALLIHDLSYAAALARIHYLRVPAALPSDADDIEALGDYWKKYYNTVLGKGTVAEFVENYKKYVL